ncbi:NADH-quinone oxidoreductase subunit C [Caldichromatium japonicum]|uniref:NADH-quinone oxidoreductase subunit C n=1 Tax=Caldichromatium japonicum TaxID=2699430 RepID=A0A6G7VBP1_9GAMM|nr:NADH-quinone oxidoreductase subunit C [Caldichromatium japonicum]QIK37268.1 NADH-quinone oxidoreductase subunit C [Caldichromatium japonicum]
MSHLEPFTELALDQWSAIAEQHRAQGFRLVQLTGTARPDHFEVMISYELDQHCAHYRVKVARDRPILPSLSPIFPAAFTYENELKDLFGMEFPGLTLDYGGNFLRTKVKIPFTGEVTVKKGAA